MSHVNLILENETVFLGDHLPNIGEEVLIRDKRIQKIYRVDRVVNVYKSGSDQYNHAMIDHWNVFLSPVAAHD